MPIRATAISNVIETGGYYSKNMLSINGIIDEKQNAVREYTFNNGGKVILRKVQVIAGSTNLNSRTDWALTTYIYDDYGRLRYVLQPELNSIIYANDTYVPTTADLNSWAFQYKYDGRGRMIEKKIPGADAVYMVYDERDRLVFTQDGNQRASKNWLFTKYDAYNRPVLTGLYTADVSRSVMQGDVNLYYSTLDANKAWFESYMGSDAGNVHGYTNKSYPSVSAPDQYLTVTYYDNYLFKSLFNSLEFDFKTTDLTDQVSTAHLYTNGLPTGAKVKSLSGKTWLKSVTYYDNRYRPIQQIADNQKGHTVTTNIYDFAGRVLHTKASLYLGQRVSWKNLVGVQLVGDVLTSTVTTIWGEGASSTQTLGVDKDGWVEVTVGQSTPALAFGFSTSDADQNFNTIGYGWVLNGNVLRAHELGEEKGASATAFPGDVLRVERINGIIYYKRNGMIVYISEATLTAPNTVQLIADVSFNKNGAKISAARLSNTFSITTPLAATSYFIKSFDYDHMSRLTNTWHQVNSPTKILLSKNIYNELGQLIDKKLHSTVVTASDAKQSVDYRYNIRGWLTSINNSTLTSNSSNDDTDDYFGMNLAYEQNDTGLGSTGLFNGNISGMKSSTNQGLSEIKETGYNFSYDPMNRLTNANSRMKKTSSWQDGFYDENNLQYDLNGNIKKLKRKSGTSSLVDDLTYAYGSGVTAGNQLISIVDGAAADVKSKGFLDGNPSAVDYSYDVNGNMIKDRNKSITEPIVYNHLNLPVTITRHSSAIDYLYDATGSKLSQVTSFGTNQKVTEYVGPWVFENNELQFLQHEEGRIVMSSRQKIYGSSFDNVTGVTATANVTLAPFTSNEEKYVQVTPANGIELTKLGAYPIGNVFDVTAGDRYVFRVKGYSTGAVNLYVKGNNNNTDVLWRGAVLPGTEVTEAWTESSFIIPPGVTQISLGVLFGSGSSSLSGPTTKIFINELELYKQTTVAPEYQYNIKDHLGNVRVTFTTKQETDIHTATLETSTQTTEQNTFKSYSRSNIDLYDHTDAGTVNTYAQLLNGGFSSQVGLAKSTPVMPGDVITAEVYGKYANPGSTASNLSGFATALLSAFGLSAPAPGEVGTASAGIKSYGDFIAGGTNGEITAKGFITILTFDKNFNLVDAAWDQIASTAKQVGVTPKVAHDILTKQVIVKEAGYAFIYISNESPTRVEVYFDDFKITHTKSPVIAAQDYYPFGLTFQLVSKRELS